MIDPSNDCYGWVRCHASSAFVPNSSGVSWAASKTRQSLQVSQFLCGPKCISKASTLGHRDAVIRHEPSVRLTGFQSVPALLHAIETQRCANDLCYFVKRVRAANSLVFWQGAGTRAHKTASSHSALKILLSGLLGTCHPTIHYTKTNSYSENVVFGDSDSVIIRLDPVKEPSRCTYSHVQTSSGSTPPSLKVWAFPLEESIHCPSRRANLSQSYEGPSPPQAPSLCLFPAQSLSGLRGRLLYCCAILSRSVSTGSFFTVLQNPDRLWTPLHLSPNQRGDRVYSKVTELQSGTQSLDRS